ncbi:MAG: sigma-70 family RNA polymerase sigma factor [Candidatus Peregrinibacteria bacterium]|nr:sigma-70 family RNA polymerase sigma factor [Candidatus Peregrinibacteria bacterium]
MLDGHDENRVDLEALASKHFSEGDEALPAEDFESEGDEPTPEELAVLEANLEKDAKDLQNVSLNMSPRFDIFQHYLSQIGKTPLLTRETEKALAIRMRDGDGSPIPWAKTRKPRKKLRKAHFARQDRIKSQARDQFIRANLRLVVSVAKHYAHPGADLLDLIQQGNEGLLRAVTKFDPDRGFKFSTYACWWIRQSIFRATVDEGTTIRIPVHSSDRHRKMIKVIDELTQKFNGRAPTFQEIADAMEMKAAAVENLFFRGRLLKTLSLDAPVGDGETVLLDFFSKDGQLSPEGNVIKEDLRRRIRAILSQLHPREEAVISLRFGLTGEGDMTLEEVGKVFNVTRERIRQIESAALKKMKIRIQRSYRHMDESLEEDR